MVCWTMFDRAGHGRIGRELAEGPGAVREEVAPSRLTLLHVARRREHAHEIVLRQPVQLARRTVVAAPAQTAVDVFEQPGRIGEERLSPAVADARVAQVGSLERRAVLGAVGAARHVRQQKRAVLRAQLHLVVRLPVIVVDLGGVGFQRVRAELLDTHPHGLVQALRNQVVKPPVQLWFARCPPLVARNEHGCVGDGGARAREHRYAWFGHRIIPSTNSGQCASVNDAALNMPWLRAATASSSSVSGVCWSRFTCYSVTIVVATLADKDEAVETALTEHALSWRTQVTSSDRVLDSLR